MSCCLWLYDYYRLYLQNGSHTHNMVANILFMSTSPHNLKGYRVYFKCNDILTLLVIENATCALLGLLHQCQRCTWATLRIPLTFLCNAERFVLFTDTESIKFKMLEEFFSTQRGVWKFLLLWTSVFVIVLFTFKYARGGHRKIDRVCQHYKHGGISQLYITNML